MRVINLFSIFVFSLLSLIIINPNFAKSQDNSALFRDCSNMDEDSFRVFLSDTTEKNLKEIYEKTNFLPIVQRAWTSVSGDDRFENIVNRYIQKKLDARDSLYDYLSIFLKGFHPGKAEDLAKEVVTDIFSSPEFASLSEDIGKESAAYIRDLPSVAAAERKNELETQECLKAFLRDKYTETIANFAASSIPAFNPSKIKITGTEVTALNISAIVFGIMLLIGRKIIVRLLKILLRRIVTSIGAKILAYITGIGGVALLLYEVYTGGQGPYPTIKEALLESETKSEIVRSIADAIPETALQELPANAQKAASQLFQAYIKFKNDNKVMLDYTENDPNFKQWIGDLTANQIENLPDVLSAIQSSSGSQAVIDEFDRGRLQVYVQLATASQKIAIDLKSLVAAIEWDSAAGSGVDLVYETELHRRFSATDIPEGDLKRLLELQNADAIRNVSNVPLALMSPLLHLPLDTARACALKMNLASLIKLSGLLSKLDSVQAKMDAARLSLAAESQRGKSFLDNDALLSAIAKSSDQIEALRVTENSNLTTLPSAINSFMNGNINFGIMWNNFKIIILLITFIIFALLFPIIRFAFKSRSKPQDA